MSAKELIKYKCGVYRSAKLNSKYIPPNNVPSNVQKFLKMWNSFGGKYCNYTNLESHDMLELDAYVHITSPIRRLADLLNLLDLQNCLNLFKFNDNSKKFYDSWTNEESMEYINTTMKSIRKVQNDCSLLNICANNTEILNKIHKGYIFDKIKRNDALYQYIIYIPELKMTNRLTSRFIYDNYSKHNFKIYIFMDEIRLKQKIRLEIINV
jgi:exoribonuclease R